MKSRLVFIDLLRGWAAIVMIEVHVVNAFIVPELKETAWFSVINFINGLVAPGFLFVAGFVFVVVSERKLEEFRAYGSAFWKQVGRILLIWAVGYLLHLPYFSFTRTLNETTAQGWLSFYQADILHCIALGLLILFLVRIVIQREELFQWLLFTMGLLAVVAAPFLWDHDFVQYLPAPVAAYVNGQQFSQFPIFNWLGFMMFGGMAATAYRRARSAGNEAAYIRLLPFWGAGLILVGSLLIDLPSGIPAASSAIRANPMFFATRLGIIFLLMVVCWYYAEKRKTERSFVLDVSKESLVVYTAHLLILYGDYWNGKSLVVLYGGTFGVVQCAGALCGLILLMVAAAKGWGWLKLRSLPTARAFSYATGIVVVLLFFILE